MKNPSVIRAIAFIQLLHKFQSVERVAYAPDLIRRENDVEHSYFLAMFCWYLCDSLALGYSKEKVLRYALTHDLHEAYAGDTFIFDEKAKKTKKEREASARVCIAGEFPEFKDLHATIEAYESQKDEEAKFVHAVDKLIPFLINYMQGGKIWKEMKLSQDNIVAHKREKIGEQKETRELFEQILVLMNDDWERYFAG